MTIGDLLSEFLADGKVEALVVLVMADILLGSIAALKVGNFRLSYVADFARNDVTFKVLPYFVVHSGAILVGQHDIMGVEDFDWGLIAGGFYVFIIAALGSSIVNSLQEIRKAPRGHQTLETALAGDENAAPPRD